MKNEHLLFGDLLEQIYYVKIGWSIEACLKFGSIQVGRPDSNGPIHELMRHNEFVTL